MPPQSRQNSSDQATEKKCLCLRPSSLLAAVFLVVAAVVLAYLGGVMSGRAYWKAHPQAVAAKQSAPASGAVSPATAMDDDGPNPGGPAANAGEEGAEPRQKVLAAEELRFSRVLRNDAATGDAPLKPMPPMTPVQPKPAGVVQAGVPQGANAGAQGQGAGQPSGIVKAPQVSGLFDYVFQVGAFKDADSVDSLRQRLEGRGMRTKMERSGKLYVVLVLLRGDDARAAEVLRATESMGLGKPIQRSRKPVLQQ
jgi:cell division protein FtsN